MSKSFSIVVLKLYGRFKNGLLVTTGSIIDIGGDEKYKAMCFDCYKKLKKQTLKKQAVENEKHQGESTSN